MAANHIPCSECGLVVPNPGGKRKTCSDKCRAKRARRLKQQPTKLGEALHDPDLRTAKQLDPERVDNLLGEIIRAEATPVIREEIGDAISSLVQQVVGIAPKALAALELALASSDARVSSRAAEILLKYTMPTADKDRNEDGGNVEINFNLPRAEEDAQEGEAVELQACDVCDVEKPLKDFVDGSTRCTDCHEKLRAQVEERFDLG